MLQAARIFNNEIGSPAFFRIGHLSCQNMSKFVFCHSRPVHDPLSLNIFTGGNNNNIIKFLIFASFVEKRNIKDHIRTVLFSPMGDKIFSFFSHKGMDERFQFFQIFGTTQNSLTQTLTINFAIDNHFRKSFSK